MGEGVRAAVCVEGGCLSALCTHTSSWAVMELLVVSAEPTQNSEAGKPHGSHSHEEVGTAVSCGFIPLGNIY